ncbi:helix-turn-helix transcriptional regulator [Verticiella sediminum]|uniref:Helix-turn-helix transcriptional regulator n=1 Tax=Verticiella sediminum TaxID=1247510 RepID=A0A556AIF7_9BURK|nr:helix-turn-helix transcriptional regulator [Verticiella sediminum]
MSIGTRIRERRKARGLTLQQVAEAFSIHRASVSDWERDVSRPDVDRLVRLSGLLRTTTDYLLTGTAASAQGGAADWPFRRVSHEEWSALSEEQKARIEGFAEAVAQELPAPTHAARKASG